MKRKMKAIFSVILALVMLFSTASVAFAAEKVTPVIVVHGMGTTPLYKNAGTSSETEVPEISLDTFTGGGDNSILNLALSAAKGDVKNPEKFINNLAKAMKPFTSIACDKNGNSKYNVTNTNYWTDSMAHHKEWMESKVSNEPALVKSICDQIGADNVYCFNYDWRLDFAENAKKLNSLVNIVKAQKGVSKVTLLGGSEGTCVVATYVDKYMNKNDLKKVVYLDGALTGVSVGNAFAQDLYFNGDDLSTYLVQFTNTYNNRTINMKDLQFLGPVLNGNLKNVCDLVNKIKKNPKLTKKLYNEVLYPVFGNIPALWEFISYNKYGTAVKKMSSIGFLDKKSGLYKKISAYHAVQGRAKSNIQKLKKKGVDVVVIANYNTPAVPITSERKNHSDILIDTKYASVGATVADYGKTLPAKRTKNNKYASPDKIIDASTCAAKDSTWFVKDVQHMDFWYGKGACKFVAYLTTTKNKATIGNIKSKTGIGQFVDTDKRQNVVTLKSPSLKVSSKGGKLTYTVGAVKGAQGYEVRYSQDKKFNVYTTLKKQTKAGSKTVSGLKKGKTYYVHVIAYKTVNGTKTFSKGTTKSIVIK